MVPCPIFPLAGHSRLGQDTLEASIWLPVCVSIPTACQMANSRFKTSWPARSAFQISSIEPSETALFTQPLRARESPVQISSEKAVVSRDLNGRPRHVQSPIHCTCALVFP